MQKTAIDYALSKATPFNQSSMYTTNPGTSDLSNGSPESSLILIVQNPSNLWPGLLLVSPAKFKALNHQIKHHSIDPQQI